LKGRAGLRIQYVLKRLVVLFLVLWAAATVNFFVPRLSDRNPVREKILSMAASGGAYAQEIDAMAEAWEKRFGLDQPLWKQYLNYLWDMARLDFGYSLSQFPKRVNEQIGEALPWSIGLVATASIISMIIGSTMGALIAWPKSPKFVNYLVAPLVTFSAVPYYILGLVLIYVFAVRLRIFPIQGGHSIGAIPSRDLSWYLDIAHHAILPALSIIISRIGIQAMTMRGTMTTISGEDYMLLAEAKGLKGKRIFWRYGVRNASLPQVTNLALDLGFVVSGLVLVEIVFSYPGVGGLLLTSITFSDYNTIYGIVFLTILAIGLATLLLDLIYPLLDPRINYEER
jgi:peptide/nickel transport system permease protein